MGDVPAAHPADVPASGPPGGWTRYALVLLLTGALAGAAGVALVALLHVVQHAAYGYTEDTFLRGVQRASATRRVLVPTGCGAGTGLCWLVLRARGPLRAVPEEVADPGPAQVGRRAWDAVLQVVAVGGGASLGREGAPRQVGAALGSWLAGRARLTADQQRTVLACGAGAGLAAVYLVPLAGTLFALEVLLRPARPRHVLPALATSAVATLVASTALPDVPTYAVPRLPTTMSALVFAALVGPVAALVGELFRRLTTRARGVRLPGWRLPLALTAAFAVVGVLSTARPELLGNGKGLTQLALDGVPSTAVLAVLLLLKPLATATCLAGGASGGLITPSLATGAALGALAGRVWQSWWPGSPGAVCVLVGAAAVLATTQRAPLTAVVLVLELAHADVLLALPMAVAILTGTAAGRLVTPLRPAAG